jgi:hypothetical protein
MQKILRTGKRSLLPATGSVGISHPGMASFIGSAPAFS